MALVAYDNSDSSEYEDENEPTSVNIAEKYPTHPKDSESIDLFKCLPRPTNTECLAEEDDEFVSKKEQIPVKTKAKITIPSLSDFKDVDSPVIKVQKPPSKKGSGLLGLLPQPKYSSGASAISISTKNSKKPSTSLIPHVLQKATNSIDTTRKKSSCDTNKISSLHYSDDSEDEDLQNDFFSINKAENVVPVIMPPSLVGETSSPYLNEDYNSQSSRQQSQTFVEPVQPEHQDVVMDHGQSYYQEVNQPETSNSHQSSQLELDEEAIRKLCGSRKRKGEVINILDVDQKDVLGDAAEMLMKGIMDDTAPRMSSSKRKGDGPTSQQKRKHQITYLAHQAKANEADLQNQWANNRINKRMTQSKYGF